ncbi:hypothetical protein [Paraclostridium tenue]|uniref:Bacteriocin n=1 Tax=Paraclostridium tenue TaxID=1737 RepID=A0ABN1MAX2_9FIRM
MEKLNYNQLEEINGGGWKEAGQAFVGTVKIGTAPLRCFFNGPKKAFRQAHSGWKMIQKASKNAYR